MRSKSYDHLEEFEAAAFLEALIEIEGSITLTTILVIAGVRPEEGANHRARCQPVRGPVACDSHKGPGPDREGRQRYVPIWPYARAVFEAFERTHGQRPKDKPLCVSHGRRARIGRDIAIQDVRVLYRKATERAVKLLDEWNVEHELDRKRVVPRCWRTTYASARVQTLDHGAPIAMGTVRVEMGHKSLYMLTRVYKRIGEVRARGELVEYRRPNGRLPGEDLLRSVLGNRFDEIVRSDEGRPTLRGVG